jgi:N-acetylmuramoyl-L-alanine amidase CwlA
MIPITENLIPAGNKNRPGTVLTPKMIIIHRTGNPGASAKANRDFFVSDPNWHSTHYCVDSKTILRCLPENEQGYHCIGANHDAIGIETCEPLNGIIYQNVLDLIVDILKRYGWQPNDNYIQPHSKYDEVNRHFDPFCWDDYKAGRCNPGKDLFSPFVFYADLKSQFMRQGGR